MHNRHGGIISSKKLNTPTVNILIVSENKAFNDKAVVISKLANLLPTEQIRIKSCIQINRVNLADPSFNTPKQVDIILGPDVFEDIILYGERQKSNGLHLRNTVLGWTVSGHTPEKVERSQTAVVFLRTNIDLRYFGKQRKFQCTTNFSRKNKSVNSILLRQQQEISICCETSLQRETGKPGNSYDKAEKRFFSLERRF